MADMDSVASVIDTSAMVRMNAFWQSKPPCSIVTQASELVIVLSNFISPASDMLSLTGHRENCTGRCGALLPLFQLVGVLCIAALRRVEKPTASPQRSPATEFLGPKEDRKFPLS